MTVNVSELQTLIGQWRECMATSPDAWKDVDLTFRQLRALFMLGRQPLRVGDLAKALGMSLASASALSDRLVRQSLVVRHPDPTDRRSVFLHIAPLGTRVLGRLERAHTAQLTRVIRQMTGQERAALATAFRAFLRVASLQARPSRAPTRRSRRSA